MHSQGFSGPVRTFEFAGVPGVGALGRIVELVNERFLVQRIEIDIHRLRITMAASDPPDECGTILAHRDPSADQWDAVEKRLEQTVDEAQR